MAKTRLSARVSVLTSVRPERGPASPTTASSAATPSTAGAQPPRARASPAERGRPSSRQLDASAARQPGRAPEGHRQHRGEEAAPAGRRRSWDPHHERASRAAAPARARRAPAGSGAGWSRRSGCSGSPGSASSPARRSGGRCGSAPRCPWPGSSVHRSSAAISWSSGSSMRTGSSS